MERCRGMPVAVVVAELLLVEPIAADGLEWDLGLGQLSGVWTQVDQVSIASSESWKVNRGQRRCTIPK